MVLIRLFISFYRISMPMLLLLSSTGCKKFVEIDAPSNQTPSPMVFSSDGSAISAITGIYSEMIAAQARLTAGEITFYTGLSSDELRYYSQDLRDEFFRNEITSANHGTISLNFWDRAYKLIYTANVAIESLERSTTLTPSVKSQLLGECRFVRAFCYFHLINLFGDVPLALVSDYTVTSVLPRASTNDVYKQIVTDLKEAVNLMDENYPSAERVRPNKWTATALLARVYLYTGDWINAEALSDAVINSTRYLLEPNTNDVFLRNSREAIWQLMPVTPNNSSWEGNLLLPISVLTVPSYMLTTTLLNAFEPTDLRRVNWVRMRVYNNETYFYPVKYKSRAAAVAVEYYMVFRLGEQYLIRAEARANQEKLLQAAADINIIRNRANLSNTTAMSKDELLAAIAQERRIELFAEWGHRWYDLKRTGKADEALRVLKAPTWSINDQLWPIPSSQILANTGWKQNPGY